MRSRDVGFRQPEPEIQLHFQIGRKFAPSAAARFLQYGANALRAPPSEAPSERPICKPAPGRAPPPGCSLLVSAAEETCGGSWCTAAGPARGCVRLTSSFFLTEGTSMAGPGSSPAYWTPASSHSWSGASFSPSHSMPSSSTQSSDSAGAAAGVQRRSFGFGTRVCRRAAVERPGGCCRQAASVPAPPLCITPDGSPLHLTRFPRASVGCRSSASPSATAQSGQHRLTAEMSNRERIFHKGIDACRMWTTPGYLNASCVLGM